MRRLLFAIASVLTLTVAAYAQSAEDFYKGKTVTYIVATAPGGGYDTYGRLLAHYMGKYLSDAKIVVLNVPGAGHIVGTDELYVAKPDGLTIGTFNMGLVYAQLLKQQGIQFDLAKMNWIGRAEVDPRVLMLSKRSGIKSWQELTDMSKPPLKFYVGGVGSAAYIDTRIAIQALHLNVEIIPGFNGNEGEMSMLRGETIGVIGAESSLRSFVTQGEGFFAMEMGGSGTSGLPQASDFLTTDRDRKLMSLITAESQMERLTAGPPNIPADRLAFLRKAYMETLADPALLSDAKRQDLPIVPANGDETEKLVKVALDQSPATIKFLAEAAGSQ